MYECSIYKDRPEVCKEFPTRHIKFKHYPSCTYWFDQNDKKQGECSRCGECCRFNKVFPNPCKHLRRNRNVHRQV